MEQKHYVPQMLIIRGRRAYKIAYKTWQRVSITPRASQLYKGDAAATTKRNEKKKKSNHTGYQVTFKYDDS